MQFLTEKQARKVAGKYQKIIQAHFPKDNLSVDCCTLTTEGYNGKFKVIVNAPYSTGNEELDSYCRKIAIEYNILDCL